MNPHEELIQIVQQSTLSEKEKALWVSMAKELPEILLAPILDEAKHDPEGLRKMTSVMNEKFDAIRSGDVERVKSVFAKDIEIVKKLETLNK